MLVTVPERIAHDLVRIVDAESPRPDAVRDLEGRNTRAREQKSKGTWHIGEHGSHNMARVVDTVSGAGNVEDRN